MIDVLNYLSFQTHGSAAGHKASDGVAGSVEALLTFLESLIGLPATEVFSAIMPGISGLANIHPLIVHFPIAFLIAFFVIDLIGAMVNSDQWRKLASGLLYLGAISAAAAVAAGLNAEGTIEHGKNVHLIMERHEFLGISILCLSVFLSLWRLLSGGIVRGVANLFFMMFSVLLTILILLGADLGGMMVYKHGVAVEAVEETMIDYFQEHNHSH